MTLHFFFKLLLLLCAFGGFFLTLYISHKKHAHEKMVCPIGGTCEEVIKSDYSRFFSIPLEKLGMAYYGVVFISYLIIFLEPSYAAPIVLFLLFCLTIAAFLFSLYLMGIQAFALGQWCTLCLTSEFFSTVIFISAIITVGQSFPLLVARYVPFVSGVQTLFLGTGLGVAVGGSVLFLKFLKDFRISEWERDILVTLSEVLWFCIAVAVISSGGLFVARFESGQYPPVFAAELISLLVLMITGSVLSHFVIPQLTHVAFYEKNVHEPRAVQEIQSIAFVGGALSFASWLATFVFATNPTLPFSFVQLLAAYGIVLFCAGIAGRLLEYMIVKRRESSA